MPTPKKPRQIRWTIPCGNDREGRERLLHWKTAARVEKQNNSLRFNTWIRETLDAAAFRILKK